MAETACEMNREVLAKVLKEEPKLYFRTPSLNNVLYIHRKGFTNLAGLEEFTGLKALYADGNAICKIENLENCRELRTLHLNENCIREISGLATLRELRVLNLSSNLIEDISGLGPRQHFFDSLHQIPLSLIARCKQLSVLDVSANCLEGEDAIETLQQMQQLKVLYLQRNPVVSGNTALCQRRTRVKAAAEETGARGRRDRGRQTCSGAGEKRDTG
ncbi:hypothetical protein Esti_000160 [Eimeria stiedai]